MDEHTSSGWARLCKAWERAKDEYLQNGNQRIETDAEKRAYAMGKFDGLSDALDIARGRML